MKQRFIKVIQREKFVDLCRDLLYALMLIMFLITILFTICLSSYLITKWAVLNNVFNLDVSKCDISYNNMEKCMLETFTYICMLTTFTIFTYIVVSNFIY